MEKIAAPMGRRRRAFLVEKAAIQWRSVGFVVHPLPHHVISGFARHERGGLFEVVASRLHFFGVHLSLGCPEPQWSLWTRRSQHRATSDKSVPYAQPSVP